MRQYRAIPIDGKDFVYGWYVGEGYKCGRIIPTSGGYGSYGRTDRHKTMIGPVIEVISETVGQQIGLKDKKRTKEYPEGQKIYDGDIFTDENYGWTGDLYKVVLDGAGFRWFKFYDAHFELYIPEGSQVNAPIYFALGYEIIGDIHTTPELMKETK